MKILFLSDLHLDINSKSLNTSIFTPFCRHIELLKPNVVIISGDIGNDAELVDIYFRNLNNFFPSIHFYFIHGNHDISTNQNSLIEIEKLKENQSFLHNSSIALNSSYTLIGWSGWYDYSYKKDYHLEKQVLRAKNKFWYDSEHVFLNKSDKDYYRDQLEILKELLDANKNKRVILSTHFVPYVDFITFNDSIKHWDICNSFLGSSNTGALIDKYPNVEILAFGHTHKRFGLIDNFHNKKIICNPLGYLEEWENPNATTEDEILKELSLASILIDLS